MRFSTTVISLSIHCLLTRNAFAFHSVASGGLNQLSSFGLQSRSSSCINPFSPASKNYSARSPSSLPFTTSHVEHTEKSRCYVSTSASSEAEAISPSITEQIESWADECQKQGISSSVGNSASEKHRVIFVLGGPGAGKGTQCENIISTYNCIHHLSAGELLRNVPKDSPHAELVEQCLIAGKIVPVEISLSLLRDAMDKATKDDSNDNGDSSTTPVFLVDGFPRNFDNLSGWIQSMPEYADVLGALVFDCSIEELEKRILDRGKTSGRSDDNLTSARKRFGTFQEQTVPVVDVFETLERRGEGLKVIRIAGEKSVEEVWKDTKAAMDEYLAEDALFVSASQ